MNTHTQFEPEFENLMNLAVATFKRERKQAADAAPILKSVLPSRRYELQLEVERLLDLIEPLLAEKLRLEPEIQRGHGEQRIKDIHRLGLVERRLRPLWPLHAAAFKEWANMPAD